MRTVIGAIALVALTVAPLAPAQATVAGDDVVTVVVTGRVDLGPTCPVQRPGDDCTDEGVKATVTATRSGASRTASAGSTGFRLRLSPRVWRITADAGMSCETVRVDLRSGKRPSPIVIACDTGIR